MPLLHGIADPYLAVTDGAVLDSDPGQLDAAEGARDEVEKGAGVVGHYPRCDAGVALGLEVGHGRHRRCDPR